MKKFCLFCLFLCSFVLAEEQESTPPLLDPQSINSVSEETALPWDASGEYKIAFFRTLFIIIAIGAIALIIIYYLKKLSTGRPMMVNKYKNIKILERRPLSPQTILYQIEVGTRQIIVAESKVEIKVLTSFDPLEKTTPLT